MTPNEALRALESALTEAAKQHDYSPTMQVAVEFKDGKAIAKLTASTMFKRDDSYSYAHETVEGLDWDETLTELAHRRRRQIAVFAKLIAAPKPDAVATVGDDDMPF